MQEELVEATPAPLEKAETQAKEQQQEEVLNDSETESSSVL
jgi:hypothetical protein